MNISLEADTTQIYVIDMSKLTGGDSTDTLSSDISRVANLTGDSTDANCDTQRADKHQQKLDGMMDDSRQAKDQVGGVCYRSIAAVHKEHRRPQVKRNSELASLIVIAVTFHWHLQLTPVSRVSRVPLAFSRKRCSMSLMGDVHQLILKHGLEGARTFACTKGERAVIEAAAVMLGEEESRLGITHAGFAMTSLPHKRTEDGFWKREGCRTTLLIESGRSRDGSFVGVPYGSIARLILLYLQTEAIRTCSPEVELGRSMKSWMSRMSLTTGGKTYQLVTEQARRISACRLTFFTDRENGAESRHNGAFVQDAITFSTVVDHDQPTLWQDRVRLDPSFWRSLRENPVPVREEAISAIGTRSLAIDVYIWLAYRLHSLPKPMPISWTAIHAQFGAGFRLTRQIKPTFTEALNLALAVYPEARVTADKQGLVLHPSPPAVSKADAKRLGIA